MPSNDQTRRINPREQETELYVPPGGSSRTERIPAAEPKAKKTSLLPWLIGGVAAIFLACSGTLGIGGLLWWKLHRSEPQVSQSPPEVARPIAAPQKSNPPPAQPPQQEVKPPAPPVVKPPVEPVPPQSAKEEKPAQNELPIVVRNHMDIHGDYQNNPIAAEKKFGGKLVRIQQPIGFSEQVDKRRDGFWLMEAVGFGSIENQYPIYGVEYRLSKKGEDQYAALQKKELAEMELIGRVKGTRPNPANIFSGVMVQITDCYFAEGDPKDNPKLKAEQEETRRREQEAKRKQEEAKRQAEATRRQEEMQRQAEEERKAQVLMRPALQLLDKGFKKEAGERLQKVIDKYPDTQTAEKARKLLEKLKGK